MNLGTKYRRALSCVVLVSVGLGLLFGCTMPEPAVYADRAEAPSEGVLAVVGGVEITELEVTERMAAQLMKVDRERRQVLERGLDQMVTERLLELEANRRGISQQELLAQEVDAKVAEPTSDEIDAFYEARKAQIRQPKDQIVDRISEYLKRERRQKVNAEFVDQLKKKHGFEIYLDPYRVEVEADGFPAKGPSDAPVTIVEFSDFECPYCARINPTLDRVLESYGDKVRLVFRQFPLNNIHPNAQKAAEASLCARDQQKFWEMHDVMFKEQRSLGLEQLKEKAARLGLDTEAFNRCLDSGRHSDAVAADLAAGSELGISGTPVVFVNGRFLSGAQPYEEIADIIDAELAALDTGS